MEILDAQKERISRIEIPAGVEATMMNDKDQDSSGNTATLYWNEYWCVDIEKYPIIRYIFILPFRWTSLEKT